MFAIGVDIANQSLHFATMPYRQSPRRQGRPAPSDSDPGLARELVGHLDLLMRVLVLGGEVGDDAPPRISRSEVAVLDTLGAEGAMSMGELAARVRVPLSTATRIVDRMVERDLVQRERPEDNRRVVRVALAGAGRRFYDEALAARVMGTERMLHYLTAAEQLQLLRLYRKMSQGLQAHVGREKRR